MPASYGSLVTWLTTLLRVCSKCGLSEHCSQSSQNTFVFQAPTLKVLISWMGRTQARVASGTKFLEETVWENFWLTDQPWTPTRSVCISAQQNRQKCSLLRRPIVGDRERPRLEPQPCSHVRTASLYFPHASKRASRI